MNIAILQFRTDESLVHERKCFENYFSSTLTYFNIADPENSSPSIHDLNKFDGIIIAGSAQFDITTVPHYLSQKLEQLKPTVLELIESNKSVLGICFGHQLIHKYLGAEIVRDENQAESGTASITLTSAGEKSELFKDVPKTFTVTQAHKESVLYPNKSTQLLASSKNSLNQALQYKNTYTVQFHPELDIEAITWRLSRYVEYTKNVSLEEIIRNYRSVPHAYKVLINFENILSTNSQ